MPLYGENKNHHLKKNHILNLISMEQYMITTTDPILCTKAPPIGPKKPNMAKNIAKKFKPRANAMIILIVFNVFLEIAIK